MNEVTLASILTKYFGCKNPVLERPVPDDMNDFGKRYLTRSGQRAYAKLISLLYDLETLIDLDDVSNAIEMLDEIAEGYSYGLE